MTAIDIAPLVDKGRWTRFQQLLTGLAALAILFDGFDIQILGFAIPSLMQEWGVARAVFGPVLAIGLVGMVAGSGAGGMLGDRYGRRPALTGYVLLFGAATLATAFVHSIAALAILRFVCGFGTGGALPNAGALVAEFAPLQRRALAVKLTIVCVPLGGMMGGLMASRILPAFGWRALYEIGGALPVMVSVLLWSAMPESPRFLAQHRARWPELVKLLDRLGCAVPADSAFQDSCESGARGAGRLRALFRPSLARDTAGLWIAFLFCLGSIYLVFGWLPAMLTAQGANMAYASEGLAVYNFGGVAGVLLWAALITARGSRQPLLIAALACAATALLILPVHSGGKPHACGDRAERIACECAANLALRSCGAYISHRGSRFGDCMGGGDRACGRRFEFRFWVRSDRVRSLGVLDHDRSFHGAGVRGRCSRQ